MNNSPLLSLIIPTFNSGRTLNSALESIYSQTFGDFEVCIIDNLSDDNTKGIVESYRTKFDNIRLLSEKDSGLYDAMNKGIMQSRGEWLFFMGSDDQFMDHNVLLEIFSRHDINLLDVIYGNVEWGNSNKIYDGRFSVLKLMQKNICHQAIFYRRGVFQKHGFFDVRYKTLADYVFNIKWFNDRLVRREYIDRAIVRYATGGFSELNQDNIFKSERDLIIEKYFPEEYSALNKYLQYIQQEIGNRDQEILRLKNTINDQIGTISGQIERQADLLNQLNNQIRDKDQLIERQIQYIDKWQSGYQNDLQKKEEIIAGLQNHLKDTEKAFALLRHEYDNEIERLRHKAESEVQAARSDLAAAADRIFDQSEQIRTLGAELEIVNRQMSEYNAEIAIQQELLNQLYASMTWRLTGPIRGLLDFIRQRPGGTRHARQQVDPVRGAADIRSGSTITRTDLYNSGQDINRRVFEVKHDCNAKPDPDADQSIEGLIGLLQEQQSEYQRLETYSKNLENEIRYSKERLDMVLNSKTWKIADSSRKIVFAGFQMIYSFLLTVTVRIRGWFTKTVKKSKVFSGQDQSYEVVFISGESETPGHVYRVKRYLETYQSLGITSLWMKPDELIVKLDLLKGAKLLIIWRAGYSYTVKTIMDHARKKGVLIIYDLDDYMFNPSIVEPEVIDAIRLQKMNKHVVRAFFQLIRSAMKNADVFTSPTASLSNEMGKMGKPAYVMPNGYDSSTYRLSLNLLHTTLDNYIRIGYAGGTRTHQKDFQVAIPALVRILEEFPLTRITLFGEATEITEFPELMRFSDRIESRAMVHVELLQAEIARFDINIAPLEDNAFCDAKSELKYFEAALLKIPTIASPTNPYIQVIENGINGFLAGNDDEWYRYLRDLALSRELRDKIGQNAYYHVLWRFSPEERMQCVFNFLRVIDKVNSLTIRHKTLRATAADFKDKITPEIRSERIQFPRIAKYDIVEEFKGERLSKAGVVVPLYNYETFIVDALESVRNQTCKEIDLVVVDDCSTDQSMEKARVWIRDYHHEFNTVALLRNRANSKLAQTRNSGFDYLRTPWILPLDADNKLLPSFIEKAIPVNENSGAALVYPTLSIFGDGTEFQELKILYGTPLMGNKPWDPLTLAAGNYIDAMAVVSKACWACVGGYDTLFKYPGWEDYDLWLRFVEKGFFGIHIPEVLGQYRIHHKSMLRTVTDINQAALRREIADRHPWILEKDYISPQ